MKPLKRSLSLILLCWIAMSAQGQFLQERALFNDLKLRVFDATQLESGNWLFACIANSITPGDSSMALLIKTDSAFQELWTKRYKALRRDEFTSLTLLSDGNILLGGTMRQDFSFENGGSVYKVDTAGNVIWHKMYDEDDDDRVLDIFEQADSTLMIFIREGVNNRPSKLVHANRNGDILSQRSIGIDMNTGLIANEVVTDGQDNYYYAGTNRNNQAIEELYVIAVTDSSILWNKQYNLGGRSINTTVSLFNEEDQSLIVSGIINDSVGIFTNFWVVKMDLQGNVKWSQEYGSPDRYQEFVGDIKPLANGEFLLLGRGFNDNGSEGFAMKIDSVGNQIWTKGYNTSTPNFGISTAYALIDGKFLLNGTDGGDTYLMTISSEGETSCSMVEKNFDQAKLTIVDSTYSLFVDDPGIVEFIPNMSEFNLSTSDSLICSRTVNLLEVQEGAIMVYPNPASDHLTIVLPTTGIQELKYEIFDMQGRKLEVHANRQGDAMSLDLSELTPSMYVLVIDVNGQSFTQKVIKQ